jgi:D-cysteine desulfhydrase
MNLARFPRRRYARGRSPIESLTRFSALLGGPNIYMKRDDLLGPAGGGNKTRKLEFLMADALEQGADTVITCGGIQSNHCRLTLATSVKEGLNCRLVLQEPAGTHYDPRASGNIFLFQLMDVEEIKVIERSADMATEMQKMAEDVAAAGKTPYVVPLGGSTPVGAVGYAACAEEILTQAFEMGLKIDRVCCASGSAGTQAGLVAGFWGNSADIPVMGINVSRGKAEQEEAVYDMTRRTAAYVGMRSDPPRDTVVCFDDYVGPGYALPTPEMAEAVRLMARTEAILLDPVYTGKVMAGIIDLARKGYFQKDENILFIHTGGSPALYVYMDAVLGRDR